MKGGWLVGVVGVVVLAYITVNTLRTERLDPHGLDRGTPLPPFAMPLARSGSDKDADVATRAGSGPAGKRPACSVRGPEILNLCELSERGPVVLAFFAEPSDRCDDEIDLLDRIRPRYPRVQFAAVAIRGDRDDLRRRVRERGWRLPVGHDRDGAVANAYAVAVCPTITFAARGGEIQGTAFGSQTERELAAELEELR